jgi:Fe2+ transport system protein FeoA
MKTINDLNINDETTIIKVHGTGQIRKRLFDMGVTPTVKVKLIRVAPFGDPLEIELRGYHLSLRKDEAQLVEVSE